MTTTSIDQYPKYDEFHGWHGGDPCALFAYTDKRTNIVSVHPGGQHHPAHTGPECTVAMATRAQAEKHWQSPLHAGWKVLP